MPLDPIIQAMVDNSKAQGSTGSLAEGGIDQARSGYDMMRMAGGEEAPIAAVEDRAIPGPAGEIPVRIFTPEGSGPFPVVVYYHGGGWTIGSVDSHEPVTRRMASEAEAIVVSVDYRLAPEHPFPAAVDDAWAALQWVEEHGASIGGNGKLAVAGDSAGGNLAAVMAILARDNGAPALSFQLLIYPSVDQRDLYASYTENAEGPFLTRETMNWFKEQYSPPVDDVRASPILAESHAGLPAALIITGQYDPLRDEGKAYAEVLEAAGTTVTLHNYETMPHVFVQLWGVLGAAKECATEMAEALKKAFA